MVKEIISSQIKKQTNKKMKAPPPLIKPQQTILKNINS